MLVQVFAAEPAIVPLDERDMRGLAGLDWLQIDAIAVASFA